MSPFKKFQELIYLVNNKPKRRGRPAAAPSLIGSQDQIMPGGRPRKGKYRFYDLPEIVLRPTLMDRSLSIEIEEMLQWSSEVCGTLTILSQNVFQADDGSVGSWYVQEKDDLGQPLENPPHPDIVAIARDLANRRCGSSFILGGQRLEEAVFSLFGRGDSFLELAITSDSLGGYVISDSVYLPTWSCFVETDDAGHVTSYRQQARLDPSEDDRIWTGYDIAKILHFKHRGDNKRYGFPAVFPNVEAWRQYKNNAADLEEAARSSIPIRIHEMPDGVNEQYKSSYRSEWESMLTSGMISNAYLMNGADIRKEASATPTLKPLIDYHMQIKYSLVPSGCPLWLVPGISLTQGTSKELGGQPALTYARLISHLRSILAEQIHFALGIEVTLSRGYDFWAKERNNINILFPKWKAIEQPGLQSNTLPKPVEQQEEEAKEMFIRLNGDAAREIFS
jgi:hypothetical protein